MHWQASNVTASNPAFQALVPGAHRQSRSTLSQYFRTELRRVALFGSGQFARRAGQRRAGQHRVAKRLRLGYTGAEPIEDPDMTAVPPPATETLNDLLDAALMHVAFDGWSEASFLAAVAETGIDPVLARVVCPRGALDLAVGFHRRGDAVMLARLQDSDLADLRFRDRIASAVRFRLEAVSDKEAVRRGSTLFALPSHAGEGVKLIWDTVDHIWTALGDQSDDLNWYSKRATLSGVYGSTVLFWLGDDSQDHIDTWAFLDRRIDDVMQIEKLKAKARDNPVLKPFMQGIGRAFSQIKAPPFASSSARSSVPRDDVPGYWDPATRAQDQS